MDNFKFTQFQMGQYIRVSEEYFKSETFLENIKVFVHPPNDEPTVADPLLHSLVVGFKATMWRQEIERIPVKTPLDWWQHFKQRWFPEWAKRLWPVVYEDYDFLLSALYPFKKLAFPKEHRIWMYSKEKKEDEE